PAAVDSAVMKALAKNPQHRYAEWNDFADALLNVSRSMPERRAQDRGGEHFTRMRALPFFADFHDAALWETLRLGKLHPYSRGDVLMQEDTPGDSFCIILYGVVAVRRNNITLSVLGAGVTLGEMTYLRPESPLRTATALAESDVLVLEVRNNSLRKASEALQTCFDRAFIKLLVTRLIATNAQVGGLDLIVGQTHSGPPPTTPH
ncbi:MAG: cyclic nucleotide-binding domain-containing protein, partial [Ramlibacter sp.]